MTNTEETTIATVLSNKSNISEPVLDFSNISKKLTNGLLSIYQKPFENTKNELAGLISKQVICITQMQSENKKLCDIQEDIELNNLFSTMETYKKKLLNIKKEILVIHKKTLKLKCNVFNKI
ncbi:PREDICTED: uncharacterized protein LOC105366560 [Ceratosolen solmsi marchali]|uniref:Uncharacterized protein LOC105366560 n=1 Tax=Ceratosolen solmsi marchali TaxID=326594 RepID=A0AAJ7E0N8_9HYME|nr:PREDICTED: uncharacterized protein LOC105366560 [Ceratosolen solmsi marchali]